VNFVCLKLFASLHDDDPFQEAGTMMRLRSARKFPVRCISWGRHILYDIEASQCIESPVDVLLLDLCTFQLSYLFRYDSFPPMYIHLYQALTMF